MPERFSPSDLSVEENLQFFATLFHTTIKENYHLIDDIYRQIEPFKNVVPAPSQVDETEAGTGAAH